MKYPILYAKNETDFFSLGLGVMTNTIEATVTEERNGSFYFESKVIIDDTIYPQIENDMLIRADSGHTLTDQRFRIKRIVDNHDGTASIYAEHISYLTSELSLKPDVSISGSAESALQMWKSSITDTNPFVVDSDISTDNKTSWRIDKVQNARQALGGVAGSILDVWGGEYRFDNYHISLLSKRGTTANVLLAYGRNITDFEQERNIEDTYNAVYPYALYTDDKQNEHLVTLDEYYVDAENIGNYPNRKALPVDFSSEFESKETPTKAKLKSLAQQYIKSNDVGVPGVSITLSFLDLSKTSDYADLVPFEELNLCDDVRVIYPKLGVNTVAKVVRTVWNVLNESYNEIEIGQKRASLSDKISEQTQAIKEIETQANGALISANGKNTNFYGLYGENGLGEPQAIKIGDLWYKPNGDETEMYQWDGTVWKLVVSTAGIKEARDAAANAESVGDAAQKTADEAKAAGQAAQEVADNAKLVGENAQKVADNAKLIGQAAQAKADEAATKGDNAQKAADEAKAIGEDVAQKVELAQTDATNAMTNANAAIDSATEANQKALDAATKADNSVQVANEAKAQAVNAVSNANDAVTNANTAIEQANQLSLNVTELSGLANTANLNANSALTRAQSAISQVSTLTDNLDDTNGEIQTLKSDVNGFKQTVYSKTETDSKITDVQTDINGFKTTVETNYASKAELQGIKAGVRNYICEVAWETQGYIDENGSIVASVDDRVSGFIPISSSADWFFQIFEVPSSRSVVVAWYTSSQTFISRNVLTSNNTSGKSPSNATYMRIKVPYKETYGGRFKFEFGTVGSDWTMAPEDTQAIFTQQQTQIDQNANQISQKASTSMVNALAGRVDTAEGSIKTMAGQIALKASKTSVDTLAGRVSSAETAIDINSNGVNSLVTKTDDTNTELSNFKQDYAGFKTNVYSKGATDTKISTVQQSVDNFKTAVENTYTTKAALASLTIGNKNLIRNSGEFTNLDYWFYTTGNATISTHSFFENGTRNLIILSNKTSSEITMRTTYFVVKPNTTYTFMFTAFNNAALSSYDVWFLSRKKGSTNAWDNTKLLLNGKLSTTGAEIKTATFRTGTTDEEAVLRFDNNGSTDGTTANFYFGDVMLAEGDKVAGWSLNPDDIQAQITTQKTAIDQNTSQIALKANTTTVNTLTQRVDSAESSITTMSGQIDLKASKSSVDTLTNRVSSAESSLTTQAGSISALNSLTDGHTTQIGNLKSSYDGMSSTIANVQTSINEMQIGGRNLLMSTSSTPTKIATTSADQTVSVIYGISVLASTWYTYQLNIIDMGHTGRPSVNFLDSSGNIISSYFSNDVAFGTTGKVSITFKTPPNCVAININRWRFNAVYTDNKNFIFKEEKLETGNKATDWSPAPEETATVTQFSNLSQTVSSIQGTVANKAEQSQVTQLANQITNVVSDTNGNKASITLLSNQYTSLITNSQTLRSNLLINTGRMNNFNNWTFDSATWTGAIHQSLRYATFAKSANVSAKHVDIDLTGIVTADQTFTFIIRAKANRALTINSQFKKTDGSVVGQGDIATKLTTTMTTYKATISYTGGENLNKFLLMSSSALNVGDKVEIEYMVLLRGTTDDLSYVPASQDNASQSQITQLAGMIDLRVVKGNVIGQITTEAGQVLIGATAGNANNVLRITPDTTYIQNATIKTAHISDLAVTDAKIATLTADKLTAGTIDASVITVKNLNASLMTTGTLNANIVTISNLSASIITTGTLDANKVTVKNIDASQIVAGTIDANIVTINNLNASKIVTGTLDANIVTIKNLSASVITSGTMTADRINGGTINGANVNIINLNANNITTGTISGTNLSINLATGVVNFKKGSIQSTDGTLYIDISSGTMNITNASKEGAFFQNGSISFTKNSFSENEFSYGMISLNKSIFSSGYQGIDVVGTKGIGLRTKSYNDAHFIFRPTQLFGAGIGAIENGDHAYLTIGAQDTVTLYGGHRVKSDGVVPYILVGDNNTDITTYSKRFTINAYEGDILLAAWSGDTWIKGSSITLDGKVSITGNLSVTGSKNAIHKVGNDWIATPAYETAESYLGDIGSNQTNENGEVTINIEYLFSQIVNTNMEYQVFVSSYGEGHVWVEQRYPNVFVVKSSKPNTPFAWEIKAKRKGYEFDRLVKQAA